MRRLALALFLLGLWLLPANGMAAYREEAQLEASILLVKPNGRCRRLKPYPLKLIEKRNSSNHESNK
jgi:hypothetical protein